MLGGVFPKVVVSPVRRPSSIRTQLTTAAAALAQRIQDFGPEVGERRQRGSRSSPEALRASAPA